MKKRKRILWPILFLICAVITFSFMITTAYANTNDEHKESLKIGVPVDRCPIFYNDAKTGEIVGIGVDLMRIAAKNAGYEASFVRIKEATIKDALDSNEYDIIMPFGSAIKSTSGKLSIVSDNLFETPFTLVTKDKTELPQFNSLHVGMLKSLAGAVDTVHQLYPDMQITLYNDMNECIKDLRNKKLDALLHNSYVWSYVLQKPSYNDLKVQPNAMFSMDFKAGTLDTPRGNEIIAKLNTGINQISDTQRQSITLDYTSRRLYQYDFYDYVYEYGLMFLVTALFILSIVIIIIMKNRSIKEEHKEKLRILVDQDKLTGVLSLEGFRKRAEELLRTNPETPYLIAYTNIKNFKYINESLGRSAGNELLCFLADTVKASLSDIEAIGRVTADRFVILICNGGEEKMNEYDHKMFDPVRNFFINLGKENRVLICYGIYVLTQNDYTSIRIDRMIDYAHVAEKKIRNDIDEGYEFYNPEQWEKGKKIAEVINYLPSAIKSGGIQVWYQPQVDYKTKKITGAEALCRWDHDKLGFLLPADFIDILEESGLIYDLDSYVWEKVCQDLQRWNNQGIKRIISVNVSRCDIREDRDIPKQFSDLIKKYNLTTDQLRIEITETAYVEKPDIIIKNTNKLRELGFLVEMDDFGSGYSSLNMLKEVPVDRIKLDFRFLTLTGDLNKSRTIISCIIQMLDLLKINMIAEGVETVEQADFLIKNGCSNMQGFYFSKALPVEEFEKLDEDLKND